MYDRSNWNQAAEKWESISSEIQDIDRVNRLSGNWNVEFNRAEIQEMFNTVMDSITRLVGPCESLGQLITAGKPTPEDDEDTPEGFRSLEEIWEQADNAHGRLTEALRASRQSLADGLTVIDRVGLDRAVPMEQSDLDEIVKHFDEANEVLQQAVVMARSEMEDLAG